MICHQTPVALSASECTKFARTPLGKLTALFQTLSLRGPTSKGEGRKGEGKGEGKGKEGKEKERKGGRDRPSFRKFLDPPWMKFTSMNAFRHRDRPYI